MATPIEFNLFAPYNKGAALIGSFTDWQKITMHKGNVKALFVQLNVVNYLTNHNHQRTIVTYLNTTRG